MPANPYASARERDSRKWPPVSAPVALCFLDAEPFFQIDSTRKGSAAKGRKAHAAKRNHM
jgi:hypothetical protein